MTISGEILTRFTTVESEVLRTRNMINLNSTNINFNRLNINNIKNDSLRLFLNRTSINANGFSPFGSDIFESQSKTVNLLQPSVPQVPLFLHPRGCPSLPVEQLLQPIFYMLVRPNPTAKTQRRKKFDQKRFILNLKVKIAQFDMERKFPIQRTVLFLEF